MSNESAARRPVVVAHRGASAYEPENTIRAVVRALDLGADAVEVDVRRSKDGALVILHDETVNRTTNGAGLVSGMTLDELRTLDAGKGERIPRVEEVIDAVRGRALLVLELKESDLWGPAMDVVERRGSRNGVLLVSFLRSEMAELKRDRPDVRCGALFAAGPSEALAWTLETEVDLAGLRQEAATEDLADGLHRRGRGLYVWTVNDVQDARRAADLGADFLVTDAPEAVKAAIASRP